MRDVGSGAADSAGARGRDNLLHLLGEPNKALVEADIFVGGSPLQPPETGTTV